MNNNNTQEIIDFFKYLNQFTNTFVTGIELQPIRIKNNTYITGLKRNGITQIDAHIKQIETTTTQEIETWIDTELLEQNMVKNKFNELKNNFFKLKTFTLAQLQYKLKINQNNLCTQEENVVYEDKKIACKETIKKRKLSTIFKSHFIHYGEQQQQNSKKILTEEEIAEMAL